MPPPSDKTAKKCYGGEQPIAEYLIKAKTVDDIVKVFKKFNTFISISIKAHAPIFYEARDYLSSIGKVKWYYSSPYSQSRSDVCGHIIQEIDGINVSFTGISPSGYENKVKEIIKLYAQVKNLDFEQLIKNLHLSDTIAIKYM